MNKNYIAGLIGDIAGETNVKVDEPMKNHTSFKVGGPADVLVMPGKIDELAGIIRVCKDEEVPLFIMGNGTNLIVKDRGIRGVVIKLSENFSQCEVKDDSIEAYAGILLSKVSNIALEHQLSGLEFASGIPGTLGGAVYMNAGAYGGEMKDVVVKTEYLDVDGEIRTLYEEQHQFGYRSSFIQAQGGVVLRAGMKLKKADRAEIKAYMEDLAARRTDKQPLEMPSAGSVFKRPEGYFTGKLIEDCGLKGYQIGGASVSQKHCGFIVNQGGATAEDVINLIQHIKSTVKLNFGVDLCTEVKIVGE